MKTTAADMTTRANKPHDDRYDECADDGRIGQDDGNGSRNVNEGSNEASRLVAVLGWTVFCRQRSPAGAGRVVDSPFL